jgi:hypothetical protein
MAGEFISNSVSPFDAAGALVPIASPVLPRTYAGPILQADVFARLDQLVADQSMGETILIQHQLGTGLIRLGPALSVICYRENFEGRDLGTLFGQDGWFVGSTQSGPAQWNVVDLAPVLAGAKSCRYSITDPAFIPGSIGHLVRALDVAIVAGQAYNAEWLSYIVAGPIGQQFTIQLTNTAAFAAYGWQVIPHASGDLSIFDNGGGFFYGGAHSADTTHSMRVNVTAAGILRVYVDNVLVHAGAVVAANAAASHIQIKSSGPAAISASGTVDNFEVGLSNLATNGLLISDGGGQELTAQLTPINLHELAIAVDAAAAADAQVMVLVLGY